MRPSVAFLAVNSAATTLRSLIRSPGPPLTARPPSVPVYPTLKAALNQPFETALEIELDDRPSPIGTRLHQAVCSLLHCHHEAVFWPSDLLFALSKGCPRVRFTRRISS